MNITAKEKQVLQKHYAEGIKSRAANLKDIIQNGKFEELCNHLKDITDACERIISLEAILEEEQVTQPKLVQDISTGHKHGDRYETA